MNIKSAPGSLSLWRRGDSQKYDVLLGSHVVPPRGLLPAEEGPSQEALFFFYWRAADSVQLSGLRVRVFVDNFKIVVIPQMIYEDQRRLSSRLCVLTL